MPCLRSRMGTGPLFWSIRCSGSVPAEANPQLQILLARLLHRAAAAWPTDVSEPEELVLALLRATLRRGEPNSIPRAPTDGQPAVPCPRRPRRRPPSHAMTCSWGTAEAASGMPGAGVAGISWIGCLTSRTLAALHPDVARIVARLGPLRLRDTPLAVPPALCSQDADPGREACSREAIHPFSASSASHLCLASAFRSATAPYSSDVASRHTAE